MLEYLKHWDRWLFIKINQDWTNPALDAIFPVWREASTWVPLYLFLLIFILVNFGKKAWPWILGFILVVTVCDQVSSHLIKPLFNCPRPCLDPEVSTHIRLLLKVCSDNPGFTSSHAANHFGMAFFIYFTLLPYIRKWGWLFFAWAFSIAYGQVYIGVHFPGDVIGGAVLGSGIGYIASRLFNKKFMLKSFDKSTNKVSLQIPLTD